MDAACAVLGGARDRALSTSSRASYHSRSRVSSEASTTRELHSTNDAPTLFNRSSMAGLPGIFLTHLFRRARQLRLMNQGNPPASDFAVENLQTMAPEDAATGDICAICQVLAPLSAACDAIRHDAHGSPPYFPPPLRAG